MSTFKTFFLLLFPCLVLSSPLKEVQQPSLEFSVSYLSFKEIQGAFTKASSTCLFKENGDLFLEVKAKTDSLDTGKEKYNKRLLSKKLFDPKNFPYLHFTSNSSKKIDNQTYQVEGILTIKTISHPITVFVSLEKSDQKTIILNCQSQFNRYDYNLYWSKLLEVGGLLVGNEVSIFCKLHYSL